MNRQRSVSRRQIRRALPVRRWLSKAPGCGKRAYPSFDDAVHAALVASRKTGQALRVYECPDCRTWHLTKRPTWTERGAS